MQVYLSSGSPLLSYQPCHSCDPTTGWQDYASYSNANATGNDVGWVTSAQNASVSLNFTGTALFFEVDFAPSSGGGGPGAGAGTSGSGTGWTTKVLVNGTDAPSGSTTTAVGVSGLPAGMHTFQLDLQRTDGKTGNETWANVQGVTGTLDGANGPETTNSTIDDTAWAGGPNGTVILTPAWNMLESNHSNFVNTSDPMVATEEGTQARNHNSSISWTTQSGANNSIQFTGSAVWAYGTTGGPAGGYQVMLDGASIGTFDASGGPEVYQQVLYHVSGLSDSQHTIQLVNQWGQLSFDYLVATTKLGAASLAQQVTTTSSRATMTAGAPSYTVGPTTSAAHSSAAAAAAAKPYSSTVKTAIGAAVGAAGGLALIGLIALCFWRRRERKRRPAPKLGWNDDRPWYKRMMARDVGWRFVNLPEEFPGQSGQMREVYAGTPSGRQRTHASGSSFGSAAAGLTAVPPAYTRRSLLPFKNNLWAKDAPKDDLGSVPMRDVSRSPTNSPDPVTAALAGGHSPLTNLQRSFSSSQGSRAAPPAAISTGAGADGRSAADQWREKEHTAAQRMQSQERLAGPDAARAPASAAGVGSNSGNPREWYDWVGLSTYGERGSRHLSNMFGLGKPSSTKGRSGAAPLQISSPRGIGNPDDDEYAMGSVHDQHLAPAGVAVGPVIVLDRVFV